jgi:hypothetical protein
MVGQVVNLSWHRGALRGSIPTTALSTLGRRELVPWGLRGLGPRNVMTSKIGERFPRADLARASGAGGTRTHGQGIMSPLL